MLVTIQNMMLLFSPGRRCPCPCSDAVLRSCEEALAGMILPFSGGRGGGGGWGGGGVGGWGPGTREPIDTHTHTQSTTPVLAYSVAFQTDRCKPSGAGEDSLSLSRAPIRTSLGTFDAESWHIPTWGFPKIGDLSNLVP